MTELKIIDFHVHVGLKENWHEWVHTYQKEVQSEYYNRYEEMIDPRKFADYIRDHDIEKAVILPEISPITSGVVTNEYVLEFCQDEDILIPFCTVNPSLSPRPAEDIKKYKLPTHPLKEVDIKRAKDGLKNDPFVHHHKEWQKALKQMIQMKARAEQQALAKWGLNYVIEKYLPAKLKDPKSWLP